MQEILREEDEPEVRLAVTVTIALKDNWSNETIQVKIPLMTDDPTETLTMIARALEHKVTRETIAGWVLPREGLDCPSGSLERRKQNGKGKGNGSNGNGKHSGVNKDGQSADEGL